MKEKITYGFDPASPDGGRAALTIRIGSKMHSFVGEEAEAIVALVTQSNTQLLQRVRDKGPNLLEPSIYNPDNGSHNHSYRLGHNQAVRDQRLVIDEAESELENKEMSAFVKRAIAYFAILGFAVLVARLYNDSDLVSVVLAAWALLLALDEKFKPSLPKEKR